MTLKCIKTAETIGLTFDGRQHEICPLTERMKRDSEFALQYFSSRGNSFQMANDIAHHRYHEWYGE